MTAEIMARPSAGQWLAGARPRTLPAAVSPVLVGTAVAVSVGSASWLRALLALMVSLALQVGVNYANDYSDGIRGTDTDRVGPLRLVGSGLARPTAVKHAAFASFAVAAVAGLLLVVLSGQWWLLAVGAAAIAAAWFYTGGRHPYGYSGFGELFVFVFFGLVAVCGTTLVQAEAVPLAALAGAAGVGSLACMILVANNLRDIAGDAAAGKHTLATRLGARGTRTLYTSLALLALLALVALAARTSWAALLGLTGIALLVPAVRTVLGGGAGRELVGVLKRTGTSELVYAAGILLGLLLSRM